MRSEKTESRELRKTVTGNLYQELQQVKDMYSHLPADTAEPRVTYQGGFLTLICC